MFLLFRSKVLQFFYLYITAIFSQSVQFKMAPGHSPTCLAFLPFFAHVGESCVLEYSVTASRYCPKYSGSGFLHLETVHDTCRSLNRYGTSHMLLICLFLGRYSRFLLIRSVVLKRVLFCFWRKWVKNTSVFYAHRCIFLQIEGIIILIKAGLLNAYHLTPRLKGPYSWISVVWCPTFHTNTKIFMMNISVACM